MHNSRIIGKTNRFKTKTLSRLGQLVAIDSCIITHQNRNIWKAAALDLFSKSYLIGLHQEHFDVLSFLNNVIRRMPFKIEHIWLTDCWMPRFDGVSELLASNDIILYVERPIRPRFRGVVDQLLSKNIHLPQRWSDWHFLYGHLPHLPSQPTENRRNVIH